MKRQYCQCATPDEYLDIEEHGDEPKVFCDRCDKEVKQ